MKSNQLINICLLSVALWASCSCAPGIQLLDVEKRMAPSHPVELANKSIAVFSCLDGKSDSTQITNLAREISSSFEKRLSLENGSIFTFNLFTDSSTVFDEGFIKDLSVKSNSDVVMLLSDVTTGVAEFYKRKIEESDYSSTFVQLPFTLTLGIYDGTTAKKMTDLHVCDTLAWEVLSRAEMKTSVINIKMRQAFSEASTDIANSVTDNFFEKWAKDTRSLYFFYGEKWINAIEAARKFDWGTASGIWLDAIGKTGRVMSACAAYNMAVVCELQDKNELAIEWLKVSKGYFNLGRVDSYENFLKK